MATLVKAEQPARRRVFDLDTFEKKTVEAPYSYPVYKDGAELADLDEKELLELVNIGAQRVALIAAKRSIPGASYTHLAKVLAGFKTMPMFAKAKFGSREEQDAAILAVIRQNDAMFQMIKDQVSQLADTDSDDDSDN